MKNLKIVKLRPHQMTGASRGSARIQINNLQHIFNFFFWDGLILSVRLYATKLWYFFYHQEAVFERNLFHNGPQTITLPEEMKPKQRNNDPNYNVIVSLD